jgi:hypothetical protein
MADRLSHPLDVGGHHVADAFPDHVVIDEDSRLGIRDRVKAREESDQEARARDASCTLPVYRFWSSLCFSDIRGPRIEEREGTRRREMLVAAWWGTVVHTFSSAS